ncbi:13665_t:CDS:2 [Racocetra fulgida]|uniref:13665_t:CDS:1 n=1 Tax=Racocetra fulgida TaxID=60492 RepID=A0A9N9CWK6_9GLOM|nr:13665_t:CDS:2 [Racocetra fulgida]
MTQEPGQITSQSCNELISTVHKMNLILSYMNMEEEEDMCVKNVDKYDGMAGRSKDIIANVMINKKITGLETENTKENDIESNESISEVDYQKLDDLEAEVNRLLSDMKNSDGESADVWCGNETYDFVNKEISLIDFDESDQMDEREPESMFNVFIEKDLIDIGSEVILYVKFAETKFETNVVLKREEIVEDLLKVLRNDDSDEFDCDSDSNIQLDIKSGDQIMRSVFNRGKGIISKK